jgi:hypothetical protein
LAFSFSTPENAPTEISLGEFYHLFSFSTPRKKKLGKKKVIKTTPQKRCEHSLLCWPAGAKKKVGVEQEKVSQFILVHA